MHGVETERQTPPKVDALVSGCSLLEALADLDVATLSQLSEHTGLTANRTFRMIRTFLSLGYIERTGNKTYRLGPKLLLLGHRSAQSDPLIRIAMPEIERLAAETEEAVFLGVRVGLRQITVASRLPLLGWHSESSTRPQLPLHTSSMGLCLLAYAPETVIRDVLDNPRERFTEATLIDRNELERAIGAIRSDGYRVSKNEFSQGWTSIGAPVLYREGFARAAVAIGLNDQRLSGEKTADCIMAVRRTAASIAALLP